MAKKLLTIKDTDFSVHTKDRPDYRVGDSIHISSPSFRAAYYIMGYNDRMSTHEYDASNVLHPANKEAYKMGWDDANGDLTS